MFVPCCIAGDFEAKITSRKKEIQQWRKMDWLCSPSLIWIPKFRFPASNAETRDGWIESFVTTALSNPANLERSTVVFFQIWGSQETFSFGSFTCPSVFCLPVHTCRFFTHFFQRFIIRSTELCILALIGRVARLHCCKLLWIRVIPMLIVFSLLHWLFK